MQYRPANAEAVIEGRKTQTRRPEKDGDYWIGTPEITSVYDKNNRLKYRVGQDYAVQPGRGKHAIGRMCITRIRREQVGDISEADAIAEGFDSVRVFIIEWVILYGGWHPRTIVWVLDFELVEND